MIPKQLIQKGTDLAQKLTIYGVPMNSLSYDELLAVAAFGWYKYDELARPARESDLRKVLGI